MYLTYYYINFCFPFFVIHVFEALTFMIAHAVDSHRSSYSRHVQLVLHVYTLEFSYYFFFN